jgi:glycosyltransferase involved in cell wall biosynthesis
MAAKVDPKDRQYFEEIVEPAIRRARNVEFVGEVDEAQKDALLGGAYAYVFPVDWPEPFGITMVEAMATGTPVIGLRRGSVPEIVLDGGTGFVCETVDEIVERIPAIKAINRRECRGRVESCFSASSMVDAYEELYRRLAS